MLQKRAEKLPSNTEKQAVFRHFSFFLQKRGISIHWSSDFFRIRANPDWEAFRWLPSGSHSQIFLHRHVCLSAEKTSAQMNRDTQKTIPRRKKRSDRPYLPCQDDAVRCGGRRSVHSIQLTTQGCRRGKKQKKVKKRKKSLVFYGKGCYYIAKKETETETELKSVKKYNV